MVIDIPLSSIEDYNLNAGETAIKTAVPPECVSAIIPTRHLLDRPSDLDDDLLLTLQSISSLIPNSALAGDQLSEARAAQSQTISAQDKLQLPLDQENIRQKRTACLISWFDEFNLDINQIQLEATKNGTDIYTQTKQNIISLLDQRLLLIQLDSVASYFQFRSSSKTYYSDAKTPLDYGSEPILLEIRNILEINKERKLPRIAETLGLPPDSDFNTVINARNELMDKAEQAGIQVDRTDYTRLYLVDLSRDLAKVPQPN